MQMLPSAGLFPSFLSVTIFLILMQCEEVCSAVHVFLCLLVCELSASLPDTLGKLFTNLEHVSFKYFTTTLSGGKKNKTKHSKTKKDAPNHKPPQKTKKPEQWN